MKTPEQQLNEDAEKEADNSLYHIGRGVFEDGFKSGALSPSAANGCNPHVEKAKIEFAFSLLERVFNKDYITVGAFKSLLHYELSELSEKIKSYE